MPLRRVRRHSCHAKGPSCTALGYLPSMPSAKTPPVPNQPNFVEDFTTVLGLDVCDDEAPERNGTPRGKNFTVNVAKFRHFFRKDFFSIV